MASNGSFQTSTYAGAGSGYMYAFKVNWRVSSQSVANNKSTIYWEVVPVGNTGNHWVTCGPIRLILNGNYVLNITGRVDVADPSANPAYSYPWKQTGSTTIDHDSNGNASITWRMEAAIYSTAISSTYSGAAISLPQIARASSISNVSGTIGSLMTINIASASSSFTHTLRWEFGSMKGTIVNKTSSTSYNWTPADSLANMIPNNSVGYGTIYCDTYNGSTLIGTKSATLTLTVPSRMAPTIDSFIPEIASTNPANSGIYVKNNSTVRWRVSAEGKNGATIKSYTFSGQNLSITTTSSSATSSTLTASGTLYYTVAVTDSRGMTTKATNSITVYDYSPPSLRSIISFRSDKNGIQNGSGIYVTHKLSLQYSLLNNKNNLVVKVAYKLNTASDATYNSQITIPASSYTTSENVVTVTYTYPSTTFPIDTAYNFRFIISDATGASITKDTYVGTKNVPINITKDNKGLAIGGFAQSSSNGKFDCQWEAHFISSPIVGSDRRLKKNIEDINVDIVDYLRPVKYNLKNGDLETTHYGFVAQDVEQALNDSGIEDNKPGLIHYDNDENTNEKINYALSYEEFIPFLVKKCQELQHEINELKKKVNNIYEEGGNIVND